MTDDVYNGELEEEDEEEPELESHDVEEETKQLTNEESLKSDALSLTFGQDDTEESEPGEEADFVREGSPKELLEVDLNLRRFRLGSMVCPMSELMQYAKEIKKVFFNSNTHKTERSYYG